METRSIIFLLAFFSFLSVSVPIMSEPTKMDNSEETAALAHQNGNYSDIKDQFLREYLMKTLGYSFYTNAETYTSLTIDDPRITTLVGLEMFTNLNRLVLRGLSIKWFDAKNYLSYLEIDQCDSIQQIYRQQGVRDSFVIKNCMNMEIIYDFTAQHTIIQSCPKLKTYYSECNDFRIDNCPLLNEVGVHIQPFYNWPKKCKCEINGCPNVTKLVVKRFFGVQERDACEQELEHLDVSRLINLVDLRCNLIRLKELDISNCHKIEVLDVSNNFLEALDISNCPKIREINVSNNDLERLDVSNCPSIMQLNASNNKLKALDVSNCPGIKEINVSHNNLEALDISNCPDLETLDVGFNLRPLYDFSRHDKLTSLGCAGCGYTSIDVSNHTKLTYLDLSYNRLSTLDIRGLYDLKVLHCESNELEEIVHENQNFANHGGKTKYLHCYGNLLTAYNVPNTCNVDVVGGEQYITRELTTLPDGTIGVEVSEETQAKRIFQLKYHKYCYSKESNRYYLGNESGKAQITQAWGKNYLVVNPKNYEIDEIPYIQYTYSCHIDEDYPTLNTNGGTLNVWIILPSPTEIKQISDMNTEDVWHTLSGVRLSSPPTQKGIYIKNGKKVAVK